MAVSEALGTASPGGSPGQHGRFHCPAVPLEAISTATGSGALENVEPRLTLSSEQAAGG